MIREVKVEVPREVRVEIIKEVSATGASDMQRDGLKIGSQHRLYLFAGPPDPRRVARNRTAIPCPFWSAARRSRAVG